MRRKKGTISHWRYSGIQSVRVELIHVPPKQRTGKIYGWEAPGQTDKRGGTARLKSRRRVVLNGISRQTRFKSCAAVWNLYLGKFVIHHWICDYSLKSITLMANVGKHLKNWCVLLIIYYVYANVEGILFNKSYIIVLPVNVNNPLSF